MLETTQLTENLSKMVTNKGATVQELSSENPVLLVFLRHFGCMFCRQALKDISAVKTKIEEQGVNLVFVHLADEETAFPYFSMNGLENYHRISDPKAVWYKSFGLLKGTFQQIMGLQVIMKGFQSAILEGNGLSTPIGDGFQMPGIFVIQNDNIIQSYRHRRSSDRPDYLALIQCCAE